MFLDYSGYETLTEINSSFGKYILLLQQFEDCWALNGRLQMLKDLGKEFKVFEKLNVEHFKKSNDMVHRFYTMVISLKQIMEIGPLIRRSPAVLIVEFECPVEDCLDELDPLHPLNKAYIFIYKQWTYYHQYYIVEKIKKLILKMAPVREDDWSVLHKVVYCDGFAERRYKKKKYVGDVYIPQPLLKSSRITTISRFSQLTKIVKVRVYRFNTTALCDPGNLSKNNLQVQELKDKDLPNLIWTLEPEKFYVDMKPYRNYLEGKKEREETELRLQAEIQKRKIQEESNERDSNEVNVPPGLKNIMKTPLANSVVNIFNNYTAVVTGIATVVSGKNEGILQKDGDISETTNSELVQQSISQTQIDSDTPINSAYFRPGFQDNHEHNTSWNTTMRDIDPVSMNEQCARVWRKEQQMLGLEKSRFFRRKLQEDGTVVRKKQSKKQGNSSEGRIELQNVIVGTKIASTAGNNNNLGKKCNKKETHGLVRQYLKVKLNILSHENSIQQEKDNKKYVDVIKYNMSNIRKINNMSKRNGETAPTNLTDIRFKDVMTVKFRGLKVKFRRFKINT
ncbi:YKR015C-like protein [Saccharomyces cerevisiae x Saccharomyces kudriavzevii VIN7]|uniref:YKR015C-like protein n=1 Tax=Saccharomyces cerevisiae x Saccharomyces kudriavzevii (strain VIN7) TaxID=1095631 RepID=H0GXN0_SACCK|nr:YKR015C-like protein [Saccharomyces cerevisiae x Saccharomyces kudriavzevii VIN7]